MLVISSPAVANQWRRKHNATARSAMFLSGPLYFPFHLSFFYDSVPALTHQTTTARQPHTSYDRRQTSLAQSMESIARSQNLQFYRIN